MIEGIIFDWEGTLVRKDSTPFPDSDYTLEKLSQYGVKRCVISISQDIVKKQNEINGSSLRKYFFDKSIVVSDKKRNNDYFWFMHHMNLYNRTVAVVDNRFEGIKIGNDLCLQTFWIKRNTFTKRFPSKCTDYPNYIINTLSEILHFIKIAKP